MVRPGRPLGAILGLAALALACCAAPPPPPARLPADVYGINVDNDLGAIEFAAWAFASPGRLRGNPVDAIRAVIAVDYLADELAQSPRWVGMPPLIELQMQQARIEVRGALGIPADAPSQAVVDGLLAAASALQAGNRQAAEAALVPPVFTLGPEQTLARLTDMPFLRTANIATLRAYQQRLTNGCQYCASP